jgi:predicted negative regulator of RcsB-dependent stress response
MPPPANPTAPKSASDAAPAPAPSMEEQLQTFWEKRSGLITGLIVAVLLAVLAKGAWDYFSAQHERDIEQAYAAAKSSADLKGFIAANSGHSLAAVAQLRIADESYTAGKFTDAIAAYTAAADFFKTGPLASRARLGLAMAKFQGGQTAEGETALKAFADDTSEIKVYRGEALFHLASAAADSGRAADLKTYTDKLAALDAASPWTSQAMQLRVSGK